MTLHLCPNCRATLRLTISGAFGYCHTCSTAISAQRGGAAAFAYAPIGHSERHPSGITLGKAARDEGPALVLENAGQDWRARAALLRGPRSCLRHDGPIG